MSVILSQVLCEVREMGPVSAPAIATALDVPERVVRRALAELEQQGSVESENYQTAGPGMARERGVIRMGEVRLDDTSPEVREFMDAYAANQRIAGHWCYERVVAETRRRYVLIDEATDSGVSRSGRFMVDRATGYVYAIRGYGKRGQLVGTSLVKMAADYRAATATFDPARRWHAQTRGSRLNANDARAAARR